MSRRRKHTTRKSLRRRMRPFTTIAVVIGLVAGAEMSAALATEFLASEERELTELLNAERVKAGLEELPTADALRTVSRRHSVAMMNRGEIFHADDLQGEIEQEFPDWAKIGENVGVGPSVPATHDAFMNSPTHRANILDDAWQTLGIGIVPGDGRLWMTQRFLRLMSGTPVPPDAMAEPDPSESPSDSPSDGEGAEGTNGQGTNGNNGTNGSNSQSVSSNGGSNADANVQRIAGPGRTATAQAVVAFGFAPGSAGGAVLADAFDFHGALAGAALAGSVKGPVVLSRTDTLSPEASEALTRALGRDSGKTVHLVGRFDAAVVSAVRALGLTVEQHVGDGFAGDAAAAARALTTVPDTVIVTRDDNFPDALAAAAVAAQTGWPILFTSTNSLTPATADVISEFGATTAHVVGGPRAVSDGVAGQLRSLGAAVTRHSGPNRVETSIKIAELGIANGLDGTKVMVATGRGFPDALAGGAIAPQIKAPVVLTEPDALSSQLRTWLQARTDLTDILMLGGKGALKPQVELDLANLR